MKKFKLSFILLFVVLAAFAFAACSGKGGEDEFKTIEEIQAYANTLTATSAGGTTIEKTGTPNFVVPDGGYDGSKVTIKFYHTMGSNLSDVLALYIEEFNKLYPNITISHEQVGSYNDVRDQISTEITVGAQPNIAYCYPDHVALYNLAGVVANLDNLIDSTATVTRADGTTETLGLTAAQKADFIEGYYTEGQQFGDGLMYTMPFSKSTEVLYYNKTFFAQNNLQVPDHWFSTSETDTTSMEYVCAKIKEIDPKSIPLGYDSESNWFITMAEQCGADYTSATGEKYLFNNATNRGLMLRLRDWYQNGWMTTQTLYGSYTSGLFTTTDAENTKSYMSIGSSAGATHQRPSKANDAYPFEVGIATIPQMNPNRPKVISQGPSVTIFNKSNPQEVVASWLFVKFLTTSVEFQAEFSMASGYVPVLKSVAQNEVYAAFLAKADGYDYVAALSAKVCLEQQAAYYTSPAFNGSSQARDQVGTLLSKVIAAKLDGKTEKQMITAAFQDAYDECEYNG